MNSSIAERTYELVEPSGETRTFRVEFGPVYQKGEYYYCPVRFHGWRSSPPDISGYDSLQALALAVQLVKAVLKDFLSSGGRVRFAGSDVDYDPRELTS